MVKIVNIFKPVAGGSHLWSLLLGRLRSGRFGFEASLTSNLWESIAKITRAKQTGGVSQETELLLRSMKPKFKHPSPNNNKNIQYSFSHLLEIYITLSLCIVTLLYNNISEHLSNCNLYFWLTFLHLSLFPYTLGSGNTILFNFYETNFCASHIWVSPWRLVFCAWFISIYFIANDRISSF
jgi:hypothetical protein